MIKLLTFLTCSLFLALSTIAMDGCTKNVPLHPGAVNTFDSQAYDGLLSAQTAIETAKAQVGTNQAAKDLLNKVIASYNVTMNSYKVYHTALLAGGVPDPAQLQAQLVALVTDIALLTKTIKGGK